MGESELYCTALAVIDRRPLVGRTAELAAAVGLLEGATAGRAGAVLVTGEAGIARRRWSARCAG